MLTAPFRAHMYSTVIWCTIEELKGCQRPLVG